MIMDLLTYTLCFLGALSMMEVVAILAHKHVMHGFLWVLHESHHRPRERLFDLNDLFIPIFAVPSIVLIYYGTNGYLWALWAGLGIAAYGLIVYVGFHDVVVHHRIPHNLRPKGRYMTHIMQAHKLHHALEKKEGAVSFGFAYASSIPVLRARMKAIEAAQR
jgi:beta-carotene 3-hydroxylase